MTSLRGNLNTVDLANILQMLQMNQREGTLVIAGPAGRKAIYFGVDGVSTLTRGGRRGGTLGSILVRQGWVTDEQLRDALHRQSAGSGRMLGQVLVEIGLVTREQLEEALRIQIEEEIYDLFISKDAQFEFIEGAVPAEFRDAEDVHRISFNVNSLIMEAAQRIDEWEWIQGVVPDYREIYRYTGVNVPLDDAIFHEPSAGRVLTAVDGRRDVDDLIATSYVGRFEVCKVLALLIQAGALEPVPAEALRTEAAKAISAGDTAGTLKYLTRLVDLHAESAETHLQLAEAYESERELERAAFHYRVYAEILVDSGRAKDAFKIYRRVFELLPTELGAADRMMEIFASNPRGLEEHQREIVECGKLLADVQIGLGRPGRAVQALQRVVALTPDDTDLRSRLIDVYVAADMRREAAAEYEALAEMALAVQDTARAESIYRRILALDPARDDIVSRLNRLISRRTLRRRSVRNTLVGVLLAGAIAVGGWYGFRAWMDYREEVTRERRAATDSLHALRETNAPIENDLRRALEQLVASRMDEDALLAQLVAGRGDRELLRKHADDVAQSYANAAAAAPDDVVAEEAREAAEGVRRDLANLDRAVEDAVATLAQRAQAVYLQGKGLLDSGAGSEEQLAAFERAMHLAEPCSTWRESSEGTECQAYALGLREMLDALTATQAKVTELVESGRTAEAFDRAITFLRAYPPPDLAARLRVPITVTSQPPRATISVDGRDTGLRTPAPVLVPLRAGALLVLSSEGFDATELRIPPITEPDPRLAADLVPRSIDAALQRRLLYATAELGGRLDAAPAVTHEDVIVPTRATRVEVIDVTSGRLAVPLQLRNPNGAVARPVVHAGIAAIAAVDGTIYFYEIGSRRLLGTYAAPGEVRADLQGTPDGRLLVTTTDGRVTAVELATRREIWRHPARGRAAAGGGAVGGVLRSGEELLFASGDGRVDFLDPTSGALLRTIALRTPDGPAALAGGIAATGSEVYGLTRQGAVLRASRTTGVADWSMPLELEPAGAPMLVEGHVVVVGKQGRVVVLNDADGELIDELDLGSEVTGAPVADGPDVLAGLADGRLVALRVGGGSVRLQWSFTVPQSDGPVAVTTSPAVVDGLVYFGAADARLRAVAR